VLLAAKVLLARKVFQVLQLLQAAPARQVQLEFKVLRDQPV
jgi:hypothetical protein